MKLSPVGQHHVYCISKSLILFPLYSAVKVENLLTNFCIADYCTLLLSITLFSVYGALIGKQYGRTMEVMNSFELLYTEIEGDIVIDREYYYKKEEQCKFGMLC